MSKEYKPLWQTVIEQHGGYEKCKEILKNPNIDFIMNAQALRGHMLEYRRQHNIFEVGDKVVYIGKMKNNPFWDLSSIFIIHDFWQDGEVTLKHDISDLGAFPVRVGDFRQASDSEIQAGKRL